VSFTRKIKAGLVKISVNDFVGEDGNIFFDIDEGVLRISDGVTPGGIPLALGGGEGGASTFRQLLDTPSSFSGAGSTFVKVNAQASALEFVDVDLFDGDYNSLSNLPTLFNPSSITTSLIPQTDVAIDLGSAAKKWRDLYLSGSTIYLGDAIIRNVDGTVELPANARVNGKRIPVDVSDLEDVNNVLNSVRSGVTSYNDLTDLPVLFSGSYNDLTDKPTLFSGSYTDLTNKPTIPADISDLTDNANLLAGAGGDGSYTLPVATDSILGGIKIGTGLTIDVNGVVSVTVDTFSGDYNDLTNKPTLFDGTYASLTGAPDLTVYQLAINAFSGSYNDLTDTPTLFDGQYSSLTGAPTTVSSFTNDSGYITDYTVTEEDVTQHRAALSITESQISDFGTYLTSVAFADLTTTPTTLAGYGITDAFDGAYSSLTGTPDLTVYQLAVNAFSGSYNDLTDTPTLFDGQYASLTGAPTALSSFTNDSGYITDYTVTEADVTQHQTALSITESQISDLKTYLTSVAFADLTTTPTTLSGYGITDAYTATQVDSAITAAVNEILGDAPALLDTLGEIADAVGDDANFVTTINNAISLKANSADLAVVATTGSYNDLADTPTVPTDISELTDNNNRLASNITEDDLITYSILFG
jgi:hypothetical protein